MSILQGAILGLVQGLAEFLPISSSGHLILVQAIMGISDETMSTGPYMMLNVLLHAGTLVAVLVLFWKDWWQILKNPFKSKTLLLLFIASVPALIFAVGFGNFLDSFFSGWFLGVAFLITALFMMLSEFISNHNAKKGIETDKVGFGSAIVMGIMQAIALLPGVSRSGSSLLGGLATKLDRKTAAKFSFMMSAPAILGSLVVEGKDALEMGYMKDLALVPTIVGVLIAAISGYLAIRFMMKLIARISLNWFAIYTAILGIVILLLQMAGNTALPPFVMPTL